VRAAGIACLVALLVGCGTSGGTDRAEGICRGFAREHGTTFQSARASSELQARRLAGVDLHGFVAGCTTSGPTFLQRGCDPPVAGLVHAWFVDESGASAESPATCPRSTMG
jgi:hypothetical protein